jgi:hypothetical protein
VTSAISQLAMASRTRRDLVGNAQSRIQATRGSGLSTGHAEELSTADLKFGEPLHFFRRQDAKLDVRDSLGSQIAFYEDLVGGRWRIFSSVTIIKELFVYTLLLVAAMLMIFNYRNSQASRIL